MMNERSEEKKTEMNDRICMIIACYQVFLPILICLSSGLLGAFLILSLFMG